MFVYWDKNLIKLTLILWIDADIIHENCFFKRKDVRKMFVDYILNQYNVYLILCWAIIALALKSSKYLRISLTELCFRREKSDSKIKIILFSPLFVLIFTSILATTRLWNSHRMTDLSNALNLIIKTNRNRFRYFNYFSQNNWTVFEFL